MKSLPVIDQPLWPLTAQHPVLPQGSCDCHAHVFGDLAQYAAAPNAAYQPQEITIQQYREVLRHVGFTRAVLVQPSVYGADNTVMFDALRAADCPQDIAWRVVVGLSGEESAAELQTMHTLGVRGVRINLAYEDVTALDVDHVTKIANKVAPYGWHLQFFVDISKIRNWATVLSSLPVDSVIDHVGHFPAQNGVNSPEFQALLGLLQQGKTWVKLSGPHRISRHSGAPFSDVDPLVKALTQCRADRLVFGTDWPHVSIKPLPDAGGLVQELYRWLDHDAALAQAILVDNPAVLYGFDDA